MDTPEKWTPRFTSEEVRDGLPMWGAITLGITVAIACCLAGLLLGLVLLGAS
jgi:hypothetical protein